MEDTLKPVDLVHQLSELMKGHEVPFHIEDEWVVPYGRLPAIRATWYPREDTGRLEVDVLVREGEILQECFAGFGAADAGVTDALQNFCINSFHVLLAAFWDKNDPDQVTTERWLVGEKPYMAFIGNFGTRGSKEASPSIPDNLFESIEKAVRRESLDRDCHWIRHFFCDVKGDQTFEVLLDNEHWELGRQSLMSLDWRKSSGYYSVRNFLVLRADSS